jgi:hypothetical protein
MNKKTKRRLIIFGLILLSIAGICSYAWKRYRDSFNSSSCANHFIQLYLTLSMIANEHPDYILPSTDDTNAALKTIFSAGGKDWFGWDALQGHPGTCCPESYKKDGSIGYVYVGDGLKLKDVYEKNILIIFCPGENHRGSSEHCHAWVAADHGKCVLTNKDMIKLLKQALERGESGEVAYSPRAMAVLRVEIQKREK